MRRTPGAILRRASRELLRDDVSIRRLLAPQPEPTVCGGANCQMLVTTRTEREQRAGEDREHQCADATDASPIGPISSTAPPEQEHREQDAS